MDSMAGVKAEQEKLLVVEILMAGVKAEQEKSVQVGSLSRVNSRFTILPVRLNNSTFLAIGIIAIGRCSV
jgi:hypothetical protein